MSYPRNRFLWAWVGVLLLGSTPMIAGGISFPPAGCAFGHWPETGWEVAAVPPSSGGRQLLRASHSPSLGVAVEAWVEPLVPAEAQVEMGKALSARGWKLDRAQTASVGTQPALQGRGHRRVGRALFLLEEYWIDAPGKRFVLRVTSQGARGLQHPEVKRWLSSFQVGS